MCATAFWRRYLVPRWAGPRPPLTRNPSSPSTCCLDSLMWVLSVIMVVMANHSLTNLPNVLIIKIVHFIFCIFCCKWRSLFLGIVCLRRVIFQYTDAWASCPHLSKYITSDAESCDIFHTTWGCGADSLVFLTHSFCLVCCLWRVKVERTNASQVRVPDESWCVRQGWCLTCGLQGNRTVCLDILPWLYGVGNRFSCLNQWVLYLLTIQNCF